jgi:hypothetical protein
MKVNKPINLEQLDAELNGKGLNGSLDENNNIVEVTLADANDATEAQLKTAIDNHVAIDYKAIENAKKAALLAKLDITADEFALLLS